MKRVSVVGTRHEETGLTNLSELLTILERIRPDVIFLEIPSAVFRDYDDGTRSNLESTAARRYRESHHVELVPVDLPTPEADFFRRGKELSDSIERRSPDYCRLIDWHGQWAREYGFAYLNSENCSKLWREVREAEQAALDRLADRRLSEIFDQWAKVNALRETAWVTNIEDYYRRNPVETGAFLVGAAHRQPIMDKSREWSGAGQSAVQWDFAEFLDGATRREGSATRPRPKSPHRDPVLEWMKLNNEPLTMENYLRFSYPDRDYFVMDPSEIPAEVLVEIPRDLRTDP